MVGISVEQWDEEMYEKKMTMLANDVPPHKGSKMTYCTCVALYIVQGTKSTCCIVGQQTPRLLCVYLE